MVRVPVHSPSSGQAAAALRGQPPAVVATVLVIAALAALNVTRYLLPHASLWIGVGAAAALLLFARANGLTWAQLGLSRDRLRAGALWGSAAIAIVAGAYLVGVLLPATRTAFLDSRYHLGLSQALLTAFVVIPLGTVLFEEMAFRSVLWGMLNRHMKAWRVTLATASLFGLWHVLPSLHLATSNAAIGDVSQQAGSASGFLVVLGTVVFTAVGGVVAGELRRRSGSLLASIGMHWATNALGVLFGLIAWKLAF